MMSSGKLKHTLKISGVILAILVGAAGLALSLPGFGYRNLSVQSGSMEPAFRKGDIVGLKSVPASALEPGDVITFINPKDNATTVTHRITQIISQDDGPRSFITKGDANESSDAAVAESKVLGKVQYSIPYLGYFVDFVRSWPGLILVIYIPALVVMIGELKRLTAYYRSMQPYSARMRRQRSLPLGLIIAGLVVLSLASMGTAKVFAALQGQATLAGNTISSSANPEPPNNTCTNNTSVNVNAQTNQSATSGDVSVQGNTSSGNSASGNASNSSSTSVNVNVQNGACTTPD